MSSIIKVNTYQDANGNALFSSDGSGNLTLSSADLKNTPAFASYRSTDQLIPSNTETKVQCNVEFFDTDGTYDNSTNYRFTPAVAGKYLITAGISFAGTGDNNYVIIFIYVNGSAVLKNINRSPGTPDNGVAISGLVELGASDYVEIYCKQNTGSNQLLVGGTSDRTVFFTGHKLIGA